MDTLLNCKCCERKFNLNQREPVILNCCFDTACKDCVNNKMQNKDENQATKFKCGFCKTILEFIPNKSNI